MRRASKAPATWAITYSSPWANGKRRLTTSPTVTAGFRWQPDRLPTAYTKTSSVSFTAKGVRGAAMVRAARAKKKVPTNSARADRKA